MKHLKTFCRWCMLPVFLFAGSKFSTAQTESQIEKWKEKEGIAFVKSPQLRQELANFSTFASEADKKTKVKLVKLTPSKIVNNTVVFGNGEVKLEMKIAPFKKSLHVLKFAQYPDSEDKFVYAIDRSPCWGTDGGIPTKQFKSIKINLGKTRIILPAKALKGLYEQKHPSIGEDLATVEKRCSVYHTIDKKRYFVFMWFSDGA